MGAIPKYSVFIILLFFIKIGYTQEAHRPFYNINQANPNTAYRFSFIHITDVHIGEGFDDYGGAGYINDTLPLIDSSKPCRALERAVAWINENYNLYNIKFVIVSGDLTGSAEYAEFMKFKHIMSSLQIPYVPIIGNHDVWQYINFGNEAPYANADSLMNIIFADVFDKNKLFFDTWNDGTRLIPTYNPETNRSHYFQNFSFSYDDFIFYALDFNPRYHVRKNEPGIGPEAQLYNYPNGTINWLENELQNNTNKANENICLIGHHPPTDNPLFILSNFVFEYDEYDILTKKLFPFKQHISTWLAGHIHINYDYPVSKLFSRDPIFSVHGIKANKDVNDGYFSIVNVYLEDNITAINKNTLEPIELYPNPAQDIVIIKTEEIAEQISIFSITGRKLLTLSKENLKSKETEINISELPKGIYLTEVMYKNHVQTLQLIKR